jgi:hypothetical protein
MEKLCSQDSKSKFSYEAKVVLILKKKFYKKVPQNLVTPKNLLRVWRQEFFSKWKIQKLNVKKITYWIHSTKFFHNGSSYEWDMGFQRSLDVVKTVQARKVGQRMDRDNSKLKCRGILRFLEKKCHNFLLTTSFCVNESFPCSLWF